MFIPPYKDANQGSILSVAEGISLSVKKVFTLHCSLLLSHQAHLCSSQILFEKLFELNKDQKKTEKKMRSVGVKTVNPYGKQTTRERKEDRQKRFIIDTISRALTDHLGGSIHEITNPEREIVVEYCHRKFKIVLSCPRK